MKILKKKVLSSCCKNIICFDCTDNWFNKMKKENCIYCNMKDIKIDDYIIIKQDGNICRLCDKLFENIDEQYYSECCNKSVCNTCLKE